MYIYKSGSIKIDNPQGRKIINIIDGERFKTRKELRKLIFSLKNSGCIVTVRFDEPVNNNIQK